MQFKYKNIMLVILLYPGKVRGVITQDFLFLALSSNMGTYGISFKLDYFTLKSRKYIYSCVHKYLVVSFTQHSSLKYLF